MDKIAETMDHLAHEIAAGRSAMREARSTGSADAWQKILRSKDFWSVRHDDMHSVRHMSATELQQSIVEDLVTVAVAKARGAAATYPPAQMFRHLGDRDRPAMRDRLLHAMDAVMATDMVVRDQQGYALRPDVLDKAMDFCGVYYDLSKPEELDVFDDMLAVGGPELAGDLFTDVATALDAGEGEGEAEPEPPAFRR